MLTPNGLPGAAVKPEPSDLASHTKILLLSPTWTMSSRPSAFSFPTAMSFTTSSGEATVRGPPGEGLNSRAEAETGRAKSPAKIDYFATSLPTMLLFDDDLQFRQETTALFLQAQAQLGLGGKTEARALLQTVLRRDPNHALTADFLREIRP